MRVLLNPHHAHASADTSFLNGDVAAQVLAFHQSLPGYTPTPLHDLKELAAYLGVGHIFVKDESPRFGLNAFKALGGSYAIAAQLAKQLSIEGQELTYQKLLSPEIREKLGGLTFITATDGNHGRGVAWTARQLQQNAVVYMPTGSSRERLENIRAQGAHAEITSVNYDDTVRMAAQDAEENNWILIQDTAWPGYEEVPRQIMQGYLTMANEARAQMEQFGISAPTHMILQAGVGSMAAAVLGHFRAIYRDACPTTIIAEPDQADCVYRSAATEDGSLRTVSGSLSTMMAGLACGEPSTVGWPILRDYAAAFASCPDSVSARGMRMFSSPLGRDPRIVSGESGAVGMGVLTELLLNEQWGELRSKLQLHADSVILLFSTEGATDLENYLRVVWDGTSS